MKTDGGKGLRMIILYDEGWSFELNVPDERIRVIDVDIKGERGGNVEENR